MKKNKRWRLVWCVNVVVLFLYRSLWGWPCWAHSGYLCNNFRVECNWDLDLTCIYIGNEYENISSSLLKCHFDVNVITVVQFYMFMVHTVMLTYLAQMCTRDRKKRGLIFFLCKCSLWVLRQSSAYFQNAQKHKSIFCAFASSFCHSCVHICIYFSNIYYQRAIRASFFF